MLQQTRAAVVIPYYERFLARFPTPLDLAHAPEPELLALWAGLGYYSRARNLQRAAQSIAALGRFPDTYEQIRALSGVGDYTAAAIASFAFSLPHAVLDGNVIRVMARITAEPAAVNSQKTRARLQAAAQSHLDPADPATYNQSLMELGATICLPKKPQCLLCPIQSHCKAFQQDRPERYPVKSPRPTPQDEHRTLLLIQKGEKILAWRYPDNSPRLAGFYELPSAEQLPKAKMGETLASYRHSIVNTRYQVEIATASIARIPRGFEWLAFPVPAGIPLSTMFRKALGGIPSKASAQKFNPKVPVVGSVD
jgi:A/G-specific adenine glycosylase